MTAKRGNAKVLDAGLLKWVANEYRWKFGVTWSSLRAVPLHWKGHTVAPYGHFRRRQKETWSGPTFHEEGADVDRQRRSK